jgi:putative ABC transport system ATP-binding protein
MIQLSNLHYAYPACDFQLDIPDLNVARGEKVAVIGPSGSGKSTMLGLIAGALLPLRGSVVVDETVVEKLSDSARRLFRATRIGLVFQEFELIEYLTVEENIRLPYLINHQLKYTSGQRDRLLSLVQQTGLSGKLKRRPHQLSQGERQRVAICRALITAPRIILADEPTGSLDPATAAAVLRLLIDQVKFEETTLLLVTHDHSLLKHMDRTIDMTGLLSSRPTFSDAGTIEPLGQDVAPQESE